MSFTPAKHALEMHQGTLFLVNSSNRPGLKNPSTERKEKTMNIIIKNGRKEGDVSLVMGQASAVFLLELAALEVKRQAAGTTGMVAGMFTVLVSEVNGALTEVKALVPTAQTGDTDEKPAKGDGDGDADDKPADTDEAITPETVAAAEVHATGKGKHFDKPA